MECTSCHNPLIDDAAYCPRCGARQPGVPECDTFDYAAFISYRHREPDASVAARLHRALEAYRLPKAVAASYGAPRLGRVFRDSDELPATGSLPSSIRQALRHSKSLVVVCSSSTPGSRWVEQEIEAFASYHGPGRVFAVLAEGASAESMPQSLRTRLAPPEEPGGEPRTVDAEPLAADMRASSKSPFSLEKLRVIAGIAGCGYDDLRRRDRARRRKQAAVASLATLAIALVLGFLGMQALQHRETALVEESQRLAAQSQQLLAHGDRYEAIETALAALPSSSSANDRRLLPEAQLALEQALNIYPTITPWRSQYSLRTEKAFKDMAMGANSEWFAVLSVPADVSTFDIRTGRQLASCEIAASARNQSPSYGRSEQIVCTEDRVIYANGAGNESVLCFDARTGKTVWKAGAHTSVAMALSNDASLLALLERDESTGRFALSTIKTDNGQTLDAVELELDNAIDYSDKASCRMCFTDDAQSVFIVSPGLITRIDRTSGHVESASQENVYTHITSASVERGNLIVCSYKESTFTAGTSAATMFDENLSPIWTRAFDSPTSFLENGMTMPSVPQCWGALEDSFDADDNGEGDSVKTDMLVVSAGTNVHLLDVANGEILKTIAGTKPIASAVNAWPSGLLVASCDGVLTSYRHPLSDELTESDTLVTDTGGYIASAVQSPNGRYLVMQDSSDNNRLKAFEYYTHYQLPGSSQDGSFEGAYRGEAIGFARFFQGFTQNSDYSAYAFIERGAIKLYGQDGRGGSIRIDELYPQGDPSKVVRLYFSPVDPDILYLCGYTTSSQLMLWSIDISEPSIVSDANLSQVVIPEILASSVMFPSINEEALCIYTVFGQLAVMDPRELRAEATLTPPNKGSAICDAHRIGDIMVVQDLTAQGPSTISSRAAIIDIETDTEIDSELSAYSIDVNNSPGFASITCNHSGNRLIMVCSDNTLRCFTLPEGKLAWETPCANSMHEFLEFTPDDAFLIVRDATGRWLKIDAGNGETICSAPGSPDPIDFPHWSADGKRLYVTTQASKLSECTLLTLSLEDGSFGIVSSCYSGVAITQDEATIIAADGWGRFLLPDYSLDDLIAIARAQLEEAGR